jgi:hypothetical protein
VVADKIVGYSPPATSLVGRAARPFLMLARTQPGKKLKLRGDIVGWFTER